MIRDSHYRRKDELKFNFLPEGIQPRSDSKLLLIMKTRTTKMIGHALRGNLLHVKDIDMIHTILTLVCFNCMLFCVI